MDPELLFYDGACGLCHRTVKFVVAVDRGEGRFRFAPIGGETFREHVDPAVAGDLPDSIVVKRADGELLVRSAATVHILRRLGGVWGVLGALLALVPLGLRDRVYDAIARARHRLFASPEAACPVVPAHLRARFDP